jgi:THUMP domain-like
VITKKINELSRIDVQLFLAEHMNDDPRELVLNHSEILGLPGAWIAEQLVGRKKAQEKLPTFYETRGIIYPPSLNLEQTSSELAATFKVELLASTLDSELKSGSDITGGFGVDTFFLSRACSQFDYVEPHEDLFALAKHNHAVLGASNIRHSCESAEKFLSQEHKTMDFIFVDPSRRKMNQKIFRLADCEPDVTQMLPQLFDKTETVLIKTSPLLDLHQGLKEICWVSKIVVVSVKNDCKEVLFLCRKNASAEPEILCINLYPDGRTLQEFSFTFSEEQKAKSSFSDPLTYLYEPNASVLKAGAFKLIAQQMALAKLHPHTHLYTSENFVAGFPGRIFKVIDRHFDRKKINSVLPDLKANVLTRNYPLSPIAIKKKFKIEDGGEKYLLGFSGIKEKFLVLASRIL